MPWRPTAANPPAPHRAEQPCGEYSAHDAGTTQPAHTHYARAGPAQYLRGCICVKRGEAASERARQRKTPPAPSAVAADKETERQRDRPIDRPTDRETNRQTDRKTEQQQTHNCHSQPRTGNDNYTTSPSHRAHIKTGAVESEVEAEQRNLDRHCDRRPLRRLNGGIGNAM